MEKSDYLKIKLEKKKLSAKKILKKLYKLERKEKQQKRKNRTHRLYKIGELMEAANLLLYDLEIVYGFLIKNKEILKNINLYGQNLKDYIIIEDISSKSREELKERVHELISYGALVETSGIECDRYNKKVLYNFFNSLHSKTIEEISEYEKIGKTCKLRRGNHKRDGMPN